MLQGGNNWEPLIGLQFPNCETQNGEEKLKGIGNAQDLEEAASGLLRLLPSQGR